MFPCRTASALAVESIMRAIWICSSDRPTRLFHAYHVLHLNASQRWTLVLISCRQRKSKFLTTLYSSTKALLSSTILKMTPASRDWALCCYLHSSSLPMAAAKPISPQIDTQEASTTIVNEKLENLEFSQGPYRNRYFLVRKKDSICRLINDVQALNKATIRVSGMPPSVEEFSEDFARYPITSSIDYYSGYWPQRLKAKVWPWGDLTRSTTICSWARSNLLSINAWLIVCWIDNFGS